VAVCCTCLLPLSLSQVYNKTVDCDSDVVEHGIFNRISDKHRTFIVYILASNIITTTTTTATVHGPLNQDNLA